MFFLASPIEAWELAEQEAEQQAAEVTPAAQARKAAQAAQAAQDAQEWARQHKQDLAAGEAERETRNTEWRMQWSRVAEARKRATDVIGTTLVQVIMRASLPTGRVMVAPQGHPELAPSTDDLRRMADALGAACAGSPAGLEDVI